MVKTIKSISMDVTQAEYIKRNEIKLSQFVREKLDEHKKNNGYQQLMVSIKDEQMQFIYINKIDLDKFIQEKLQEEVTKYRDKKLKEELGEF